LAKKALSRRTTSSGAIPFAFDPPSRNCGGSPDRGVLAPLGFSAGFAIARCHRSAPRREPPQSPHRSRATAILCRRPWSHLLAYVASNGTLASRRQFLRPVRAFVPGFCSRGPGTTTRLGLSEQTGRCGRLSAPRCSSITAVSASPIFSTSVRQPHEPTARGEAKACGRSDWPTFR
jgi:hypothetical protein